MKILKNVVRMGLIAALSASMAVGVYAAEKTAYSFTYEKQQVKLGEEAKGALKKLGDYNSDKILTNCADDSGVDKVYIYDAFDVYTTKSGSKEIVNEITLKTSGASTEEGLKVGDTPERVKSLYSSAKGSMGLYTVTLGDTSLVIDCGFKDDKVVSITYQYTAK